MRDQAPGVQISVMLEPQSFVAAFQTEPFDLNPYIGIVRITQASFIVVGELAGSKVQHSHNASVWADVPGGTFNGVGDVGFHTLSFDKRSMRRHIRVVNDTQTFQAFVVITTTLTPIRA